MNKPKDEHYYKKAQIKELIVTEIINADRRTALSIHACVPLVAVETRVCRSIVEKMLYNLDEALERFHVALEELIFERRVAIVIGTPSFGEYKYNLRYVHFFERENRSQNYV